MPSVVQIERGRGRTVQDAVLVSPAASITARIEGLGHDLNVLNADIVRAQRIETPSEAVQIRLFYRRKN